MTRPDHATTLRWLITHRWGDPAHHAEALEHIDAIVGYPPPGAAPAIQPDLGDIATSPDPVLDDIAPRPVDLPRVAIVIGHNSRAPGAWADEPIGQSEYVYNNAVYDALADWHSREHPPYQIRRFLRRPLGSYWREIRTVYRDVEAWAPDLIMEWHFNGGGGDYAVTLYANGSEDGKKCAVLVTETFAATLGIDDRGAWARDPSERGGASLHAASAPTVLTEPFFGDDRDHARAVHRLGMDGMAEAYHVAITQCLAALA